MKFLQSNPMLFMSQESLSQLYITIAYLKGKKKMIAGTLSRISNNIKIPTTRVSTSSPDNRHNSTAQLPIPTNHLILPTPHLTIPIPVITSSTATMPSQTNNRMPAGNSTRRYEEDNPKSCGLLHINHHADDRTRARPSQVQQPARANRQPLAQLSPTTVNRLRQAATEAMVATTTNATTTRAEAQQARLVIEAPNAKKFLHSIGINDQPALLDSAPTPMPNHIPLNQLGARETAPDRYLLSAGPCQHRHTTSLMRELSAEDFTTDKKTES